MRYPFPTRTRHPAAGRRGFTLIEAAMVTVIIGVGVVAMLQLLAAGTVSNSEGTELTTAINLANNIREMSLGLAYYDPTDMAKNPPVYTWDTREATVKDYDNIMDLDGTNATRITTVPGINLDWSPDGTRIVFTKSPTDTPNPNRIHEVLVP